MVSSVCRRWVARRDVDERGGGWTRVGARVGGASSVRGGGARSRRRRRGVLHRDSRVGGVERDARERREYDASREDVREDDGGESVGGVRRGRRRERSTVRARGERSRRVRA